MLSGPAEEGPLWPFTCATCGIGFANKPSKNNHMISVHQTGTQHNSTEFDEFEALPEGTNRMMSYPAEEGLLWPFTCATCGIGFANKPSKNNHMITVHQTGTQHNSAEFDEFEALPEGTNRMMPWLGEECLFTGPFTCVRCGIGFANKPSKKIHMIIFHWNDDRFTCELCHKSILKINFRRHQRAHENGRRFHCGACKKDYSTKGNLKQHLKSSAHTGERPFDCAMCGKKFFSKRDRDGHVIRVHQERTQCELCEKSVKIQRLEWHMMREHFVYPIESNPMECNPIGINSMEINEMELNPIWISSLISTTPNRSSSLALFVDEYAPVRDLDVDVIVIDD